MCERGQQLRAVTVRYIFYDVNPGEGFNLRRDVFMRVAVLVKKLNELGRGRFVLVLPPWGGLYHWQTRELGRQTRIPWRDFFDVGSISRFVPAVDLEEYLARHEPVLDEVLYLQRYKEGWNAGEFVEKRDFRECIDPPRYRREEDGTGLYRGWFWDHGEVRARRFRCLSVQGSAWSIKDLVLELLPGPGSTLMLDRAEQVLHDFFGDENYWSARRSMRFAPRLVESADAFRRQRLHSDDRRDGTRLADRWEDQRPERSPERGGDYLCLHLRRKDYVRSRQGQIPSLEGAAEQARRKMGELGLRRAFVATDAPEEEFRRFGRALAEGGREDQPLEAVRFEPDWETLRAFGDGGVAIVDQIICSRAKLVDECGGKRQWLLL